MGKEKTEFEEQFVSKTEKAKNDILLENQKYIRKEINSVLEEKSSKNKPVLNISFLIFASLLVAFPVLIRVDELIIAA